MKLSRLPRNAVLFFYRRIRDKLAYRFGDLERERKRLLRLAASAEADLQLRRSRLSNPASSDVYLFMAARNEMVRLPFFFDYYRKLGVSHFFVVDNASDDGSQEFYDAQPDVSWWSTQASYKDARFGMDWVNFLLGKFGVGHWCVTCDPDEFLVFPLMDKRSLPDLSSHLDNHGWPTLGTLMIDMYPEGDVAKAHYRSGSDPLSVAPLFDPFPYFIRHNEWMGNLYAQGGVRLRKFFADQPAEAPALNKTSFVKWQKGFAYRMSMHDLLPAYLNWNYDQHKQRITGATLHFKFLDTFSAKVSEELERKEHYAAGREYEAYASDPELVLSNEQSRRYEDWRTLEANNLISRGGWL